jgi:GNAT superfamily N-acetyltransferase
LTVEVLTGTAGRGHLWAVGPLDAPEACGVFTPEADHLYLGKLAVRDDLRGRGLGRTLIDAARDEARRLGLPVLRLQSRVDLVEVHAAFAACGFRQIAATAHPGFDRPTSLTFERPV